VFPYSIFQCDIQKFTENYYSNCQYRYTVPHNLDNDKIAQQLDARQKTLTIDEHSIYIMLFSIYIML